VYNRRYEYIIQCGCDGFRVKSVNHGEKTCDSWVLVTFYQTSCLNSRDGNQIQGKLDYFEKLKEIIKLDCRSFKCMIFKCKWLEFLIGDVFIVMMTITYMLLMHIENCWQHMLNHVFFKNVMSNFSFILMSWMKICGLFFLFHLEEKWFLRSYPLHLLQNADKGWCRCKLWSKCG